MRGALAAGGLALWRTTATRGIQKGSYEGHYVTVLKIYEYTADIRMIGMVNHDGLGPCDRHVLINELQPAWMQDDTIMLSGMLRK